MHEARWNREKDDADFLSNILPNVYVGFKPGTSQPSSRPAPCLAMFVVVGWDTKGTSFLPIGLLCPGTSPGTQRCGYGVGEMAAGLSCALGSATGFGCGRRRVAGGRQEGAEHKDFPFHPLPNLLLIPLPRIITMGPAINISKCFKIVHGKCPYTFSHTRFDVSCI